jgi:hypothetical protein
MLGAVQRNRDGYLRHRPRSPGLLWTAIDLPEQFVQRLG